ncbi:autophagy protein Apg6-domain-containing protein [Entophlyctis helioformis]|nr:autophagy protein Apg6-domain-containing protein [Entophlyctis helioformis]
MSSRWHSDVFLAHFFCQSCGQPVKLDPSLLDHATLGEALAPLSPYASADTGRSTAVVLSSSPMHNAGHAISHVHAAAGSTAASTATPAPLRPSSSNAAGGSGTSLLRRPSFPSRLIATAAATSASPPGSVPAAGSSQQMLDPPAAPQLSMSPPTPTSPMGHHGHHHPQPPQHAHAIHDSFVVLARQPGPAMPDPSSTATAAPAPVSQSVETAGSAASSPRRSAARPSPTASLTSLSSASNGALTTAGSHDHRGNLSHRLKVANRLFEIVSSVGDADHPLCQECADELVTKLEKQLGEARVDRDAYAGFLSSLTTVGADGVAYANSDTRKSFTPADIEALRKREEDAMATLRDLEREQEDLQRDILEAEADLRATRDMEMRYWQDVNDMDRDLSAYQNQLESINLKYDQATKKLDVLSKTNVYNDAFRVWHDGPFGTINGLRLGRLPNHPVEWSEINAAMGQTVFLLDTLAHHLSFTFTKYRLVPMGSFSRIERIDGDKAVYELYGSSDITGMLFWNRRFDYGLTAFLSCVQQLGDFAEKQDNRFRLPYRISKDKIGDASIKLQFNQDEVWTKALKYTLIDVKWILAFCCSRPDA